MWYNIPSNFPALCAIHDCSYYALVYYVTEDGKAFEARKEDIYNFDSGYWKIDSLSFIAPLEDILITHYPEALI